MSGTLPAVPREVLPRRDGAHNAGLLAELLGSALVLRRDALEALADLDTGEDGGVRDRDGGSYGREELRRARLRAEGLRAAAARLLSSWSAR
jgi:hypothetical protein